MATPTAEIILFEMREKAEEDPGAMPTTNELASWYDCDPKELYDHDTDTGPLYDLVVDGKIRRESNNDPKDPWYWEPVGMKIVWDD